MPGSLFGTTASDDFPLVSQPAGESAYGENHAFWIFDKDSRIYINMHVNSIESCWRLRRETLGVCLPDGEALVGMNEGTLTRQDAAGGSNLLMECVEPFKRWRLTYAGTLLKTTQARLAAGPVDERDGVRVICEWQADVSTDAPVVIQGAVGQRTQGLQNNVAERYIGGARYEQLLRADVRFRVQGQPEVRFSGTGTRTHRRGVRKLVGYAGHDWQAALFPSGDGFYFMRFPNADGTVAYSEACVIRQGRIHPADVMSETWIRSRQVAGEKMHIRLRTSEGESVIVGETLGTVLRAMNAMPANPYARLFGCHADNASAVALSQAWARYTMNGETGNGLCERSTFAHRLSPD
jgi:hypothetical protein